LNGITVSFGPFAFEPQSGRLTKSGRRIKLQPKSAALLACLLEHPGAVIGRAEIQKRLWPEGTYVDFEIGIRVAMKKLRGALCDSAEAPTYIQTVPGAGYRFIATVEANAADPAPPPARRSRRGLWTLSVGAMVLALAAIWILSAGSRGLRFGSRDSVVIAAFENRTGESLLDGTLEYALERELSQSRHVNVAPRDRIDDVLTLMRHSTGAVLDERLARQVAVRDGGIKAVLSGRVEKLGGRYVLTVRLVNPATGATVAVFDSVGTQEELLPAVRTISGRLRRELGETVSVAATDDPQVYRVTTPSLAALRLFAAGAARLNSGYEWAAAAALFEQAVQEDPDFATAHIYAARCYSNLNQDDRAAPHYEAAYRLAPGVSERERLFILGSYHERYLRDDQAALPVFQTLASLYPDHLWGVANLLGIYHRLHMPHEEVRELKRIIQLRPARVDWLYAVWSYHTFARPDRPETKRYGDQLRGLEADAPDLVAGPDLDAATERWRSGDIRGAAREVARLTDYALRRGSGRYQRAALDANLALGRTAAAQEICRQGSMSGELPGSLLRRDCMLRVAYARDNRPEGTELLSATDKGMTKAGWLQGIMLATMWIGSDALAERWTGGKTIPMTAGFLLLARNLPAEAVQQFGQVDYILDVPVKGLYGTPSTLLWFRYGLAIGLEKEGRLQEAIDAIEPFTRPSAAHLSDAWPWLQCRAKVAELYRKAGRVAEAARVEDDLRRRLAEADPDHPLRVQLLRR
jgi:DNA-binding winged helix-turn-helix (wHTH) protein/tetratricopeptide (TPR) repeat protein